MLDTELKITAEEHARTDDMTDAVAAARAFRDANRKQASEAAQSEKLNHSSNSSPTNGLNSSKRIQTTPPEITSRD